MKRQHPLLSPTGLAVTALALTVLGLLYWQSGGAMFSPGDLAAAHVEIEDCAVCHQPLKTTQGTLCMACHTEIQDEIQTQAGLHARLTAPDRCLACHPDHRGPDFDMVAHATTNFDHSLTTFSLARHTQDFDGGLLDCADCHTKEDYTPDLLACRDCHAGADTDFMDAHVADFGTGCLECHDGVDRFTDFNHAATRFALAGRHAGVECAACHAEGRFEGLPLACEACHAEPDVHLGLFQNSCADCHSPEGWTPAAFNGTSFDHFAATGFSLVRHAAGFAGEVLNCRACHADGLDRFEVTVCEQCHLSGDAAFMQAHTAQFGPACLDCHDGVDAMADFDHSLVFVLDGAHAQLDCAACHADHTFAGTPQDCAGCHAEPAIHAGLFGLQCANCHSTAAWQPAVLTSHAFPLNHGGEGEIPCATCHVASFVQYTCDACHEPAEMVEEHAKEDIFDIAMRCLECHPTGLQAEGDDD